MYNQKSCKLIYKIYLFAAFFSVLFLSCLKEAKEAPPMDKKDELKREVRKIDDAELKNKIENRNGNLLFINVWATWCESCVEEFSDIVRIANEYKNKGVDFLSLSADFDSKVDSSVVPFLISQKADFPVFVMKEKNSDKIINMINKDWSGALHATVIYDKNGNLRLFVMGAHNYNYFKTKIDSIKTM